MSIAVADKAVKELNAEEQKTLADDLLVNNTTVKANDIDDYKNKKDEKTPFSIDDFNADITQIKSLFNKGTEVFSYFFCFILRYRSVPLFFLKK